jgi:hypothetical protein
MRVDRCDFSGYRVYPGKGRVYVRGDSKVRWTGDFSAWEDAETGRRLGAVEEREERNAREGRDRIGLLDGGVCDKCASY